MKRALMIALLLCIAVSQANASYYLLWNGQDLDEVWINPGETATITVCSTDLTPPGPDAYWGAGAFQLACWDPNVNLFNPQILPAAGTAYAYAYGAPYEGAIQYWPLTTATTPGAWVTADFTCYASTADVLVDMFWYEPGTLKNKLQDRIAVHQRPEPDLLMVQWEGDYVTVVDNNRISFVYDRSNNGYHLHNGQWQNPSCPIDYRPTLVAGALNGHSAIQFDGGQFLEYSNLIDQNDSDWNLAGRCTWFAVVNQFYPSSWPTVENSEWQYILSDCYGEIDPLQEGDQSDYYGTWGIRSKATVLLDDTRSFSTSVMAAKPDNGLSGDSYAEEVIDVCNPSGFQSGWRIISGVWDNGPNTVTIDGQIDGRNDYQKGTQGSLGDTGSTTKITNLIGTYLGARSYAAVSGGKPGYFQGQIAEVRIYRGAMDPNQINQEIHTLRSKYGLEISCSDMVTLKQLANDWLRAPTSNTDFEPDGIINFPDFAGLASVWNPPCERPVFYYVAQEDGSDFYNGLYPTYLGENNGPFKTIQKAASTMLWGDTCYIRNGTYRETVIPVNSGTTYINYDGESPVISGCDLFAPRAGCAWSQYNGSIYVCQTDQSFEQLFVDGRMMNEARWPNCDVNQMIWAAKAVADNGTDKYHLVDADLPAPLNGSTWVGAKIWINSGYEWTPLTKKISSYTVGGSLTFENSTWVGPDWEIWYSPRQGNPYYLFGSLAGLDRKEEWVLENSSSPYTCYLWTNDSNNPANHIVEIKRREHGFILNNKNCVEIDGLRFFACGVEIDGSLSTNNSITNCRFKYLNNIRDAEDRGLSFLYGLGSNRIYGISNSFTNNRVYIAAGHGLYDAGRSTIINNNRFYGMGYFVGAAAIQYDNLSSHGIASWNTVESCGRSGIEGYFDSMAIKHNLVYDTMQYCQDGGCIYTCYNEGNGTNIAYNMCYNAKNWGVGIYLDWYSTDTVIHHNKIWNCSDSAIRLNSPSEYNKIYNNTCADGTRSLGFAVVTDPQGIAIDSMLGSIIKNNIFNGAVEKSTVKPPLYTNNVYSDTFTNWLYPSVGSPAYNGGVPISGITCPNDINPDCGAFDHSYCDDWTCGSNLSVIWW